MSPSLAAAQLQWHGPGECSLADTAACEAAYLFNFMEQALPDTTLGAGCILSHQASGFLVLRDHLSCHGTPSGCALLHQEQLAY